MSTENKEREEFEGVEDEEVVARDAFLHERNLRFWVELGDEQLLLRRVRREARTRPGRFAVAFEVGAALRDDDRPARSARSAAKRSP